MEYSQQRTGAVRRASRARIAGALLALGGLGASVLAADAASAATTVVVSKMKTPKNGTVLASGKTVYTLKPSSVPCDAACLAIWPALTLPNGVTKAKAGKGVQRSKLGSVTVNGVRQVTYKGKLLYFYSGDHARGQVNGNITDEWGKWTAVVITKPKAAAANGGGGAANNGSGGPAF
jgi:predicted lipoprotein with Yx(FWY)xxD motif